MEAVAGGLRVEIDERAAITSRLIREFEEALRKARDKDLEWNGRWKGHGELLEKMVFPILKRLVAMQEESAIATAHSRRVEEMAREVRTGLVEMEMLLGVAGAGDDVAAGYLSEPLSKIDGLMGLAKELEEMTVLAKVRRGSPTHTHTYEHTHTHTLFFKKSGLMG
jgi:hypothetical protein